MPKRTDIKSILIIGSGPIVIGQACEFDYSGTQACVALKEEGYKIILINSNPATIMTDPDLADVTYIEPITANYIEKIIEIEKPNAILPTMGGQTALNSAVQLYEKGILKKHNVELIGASYESIQKAEDREKFKDLLNKINLKTPKSFVAKNSQDIQEILCKIGLPAIVRPSFTLGGFGGGVVYTEKDYFDLCLQGLSLSPQHEIQIDESIYGWKEYELEVMRDKNNNAIIVCSVENIDPVGIHTGDSITVAPAQTLSDKEYQVMRQAAILIMQEVGVESGGANVQFAVNPVNGEMVVIEMNPRVSRSSALASKATGYPIARIAAKLAVGFTLDELSNEITSGKIPASFEPTIDYVVTKIPRFDLDKFPGVSHALGSQMKSVGEVMAIGRTFQESFQKAIDSLETDFHSPENITDELLAVPSPYRFLFILNAFRAHKTISEIHELTKIDNWFLYYMKDLIDTEYKITKSHYLDLNAADWKYIKQKGFSDSSLAKIFKISEDEVRAIRKKHHCFPSYKKIDTCAGEFSTPTDYIYSSYDSAYPEKYANDSSNKKIIILGSGPNRIGQGIEFDYCCVHAVQAVRNAGFSAIMINCNPETVSTDYNISDKLYFEPITFEKVMDIIEVENPVGAIIQLGGQTPLKLAKKLQEHGVSLLGSTYDVIHKAESREEFRNLINKLGFLQPMSAIANNPQEILKLAEDLHYPLIIRPSYVLGGRAMKIVYNHLELEDYLDKTKNLSFVEGLLLEHFVENAIEIDVDAVCDGEEVIICGVMEHIERVGVHSGDSACCFPVFSIPPEIEAEIKNQMVAIALELGAVGLINAQFAVKDSQIYIIEVNPRASRTIPFISKATGIAWVKVAVNCMLGKTLHAQNIKINPQKTFYAVKESVFPFSRLPGSMPVLGPEMKSTGEVMGFGQTFYEAFYKAQSAAMLFKKSLFAPDKFILMSGVDATIVELIKPLNINILLDEDTDEAKGLIKSGAVVFMINLTGFSKNNVSSLFLLGVRLGISYVTSVPALLGMLGSLVSTEDYQGVKSIQQHYKS